MQSSVQLRPVEEKEGDDPLNTSIFRPETQAPLPSKKERNEFQSLKDCLKGFHVIKKIGEGSYGEVFLIE